MSYAMGSRRSTICSAPATLVSGRGGCRWVVLLDINLPKLSGIDVLKRVRAEPQTQLLPVVMFTSSDEDHDRLRSYDAGANSFVNKPLEFQEFMNSAAKLGSYWLSTNLSP